MPFMANDNKTVDYMYSATLGAIHRQMHVLRPMKRTLN